MHILSLSESIQIGAGVGNVGSFYSAPPLSYGVCCARIVHELAVLRRVRALCVRVCEQSSGQMILKHHVTPNLMLVATVAGVHAAVQARSAALVECYALVHDCLRRLFMIGQQSDDVDQQLVLECAIKMLPTQIAHYTCASQAATSVQRARSLTFIRDCLQMDGIEFAVQVARDRVADDRQRAPAAAHDDEDFGVVVERQVIAHDMEKEEEDVEQLLSTPVEEAARVAAAQCVDYAMHTCEIGDHLRAMHTVKCVRDVYLMLKRLPITDQPHSVQHDRRALKRLRRVQCALRARWHALKTLKSTKQDQRLATSLEMLKSECLQLLRA